VKYRSYRPADAGASDDAAAHSTATPGKATLAQALPPPVAAPADTHATGAAVHDPATAPVAAQRRALPIDAGGALQAFATHLPAVQRRASGDTHTGLDDDAVRAVATHGVAGSGGALPHLAQIQRSFGAHDVTGVRAHIGGAAAAAADALGAEAYATGNAVAFRESPSLFLAAHEAAHVVQQRGGVQLSGAIGQAGDAYERHADEVAARVVAGESAADLLSQVAGTRRGGTSAPVVSRWHKADLSSMIPVAKIDAKVVASGRGTHDGQPTPWFSFQTFDDKPSPLVVKTPEQADGDLKIMLTGEYMQMMTGLGPMRNREISHTVDFRVTVVDGKLQAKRTDMPVLPEDLSIDEIVEQDMAPWRIGAMVRLERSTDLGVTIPVGPVEIPLKTSDANLKVPFLVEIQPLTATRPTPVPVPPPVVPQPVPPGPPSDRVPVPDVPERFRDTVIHFDVGKARPTAEDKRKLPALCDGITEDTEVLRRIEKNQYKFYVDSYASTTGSEASNKELSERRRKFVIDNLNIPMGAAPGGGAYTHVNSASHGEETMQQKTGLDETESPDYRVSRIRLVKIEDSEPGIPKR
jgi:outer membrane protein OmpA-like peptidoglycan-associated protein